MTQRFRFPSIFSGTRANDTLNGTDGADIMFSFDGDDVVSALDGHDIIDAGSGNDIIDAGNGNDLIKAGTGDDTITGGLGNDLINGGRGFDTAIYAETIDQYEIQEHRLFGLRLPTTVARLDAGGARAEIDTITEIEALHFTADDYTLFLNGRNNAVLARDDASTASEDAALTISIASLLANDREFDGDLKMIAGVDATSARGASISFAGGEVVYRPAGIFDVLAAGETATDSFSYSVDDGKGGADRATVTVTITGVNDAPVIAAPSAVSFQEGGNDAVATVGATDVDSAAVSFGIAGGADAALFRIDSATGVLTFLAAPDFEAPADADANNLYEVIVSADDGQGGTAHQTIDVTITDQVEMPVAQARINEFHYDNTGADAGEFVEIRTKTGDDVSALLIELYNGANGTVYNSATVSSLTKTLDGTYDYYVWSAPGLQNGSPDGIALSNGGQLIEFLSYEGSFTAVGGAANGVTSTDIGQIENGSGPIGESLQRNAAGDWDASRAQTPGATNDPAVATPVVINEIAVNTTGVDWEFVELFGGAGTSLDGYALLQVDGDGDIRSVVNFDGQTLGENGYALAASAQAGSTFGVAPDVGFADNTFTNVSSTFLLVEGFTGVTGGDLDTNNDGVLDVTPFASIVDSVAVGDDDNPLVYSANRVGPDGTFLAAGAVRNPEGDGPFEITSFADASGYSPTAGSGGAGAPTARLISEIQGSGAESAFDGQRVLVSAIVTYSLGNGFFLQEQDLDADGASATSEGIFVFTQGAPTVEVGDLVEVVGTVDEFFGLTQITDLTSVNVVSSGHALPTAAAIALSGDAVNFEQYEGMRIEVASGTSDPLTVIENFNLDRFGEIRIGAGNQTQPTQLFDAQTEAAEMDALQRANANNRLLIDDGVSRQNPDSFAYIPANVGDDGDGILDAGDTFSAEGPTLRLGTQIDGPITGVLSFGFEEYRMLVDGVLNIDEATNSGARPDAPGDVGGAIKAASFNVLNFFSTLQGQGGSGPDNLAPRGATTQADLDRQIDNLVNAIAALNADVIGLQELENNGFGSGSAIQLLIDSLNAVDGAGAYAFVDPTGGDPAGFIGADAITAGIIYKPASLTLVASDFLVFDEASAATTFALADVLNPFVSPDAQVGDFQRSRPAIAATFEDANGETFTLAVNHLKSKGASSLDTLVEQAQLYLNNGGIGITQADIDALKADPNYDQGDGQAFWNAVRNDAAGELIAWLETGYAGANGDTDTLIVGDFNSYAQEDPVQTIRDIAGYADLIDTFIGQENAYSFVFDGQRGTLDQAFASASLASQITGVTEWHINADEPDLLNYSSQFKNPAFFSDDVFAAADHDPVLIGLNLGGSDPLLV